MILEEETHKRFGYYSTEWAPHSKKRIVAKCDNCGKIREIYKGAYSALCLSCSMKGGKGSMLGKHHSEKARKSMSEANKGKKCYMFGKYHTKETRKKISEAHEGRNNPNWQGGISFEPYCHKFNNKFKEYIRDKFDRKCYLCEKTEEENGQRLSIHHCNYDKNCGCSETEADKKADDKTCQFVPLCISCNSKVNKDRDKWEKYFKNKLRNKLNGWYI